MANELVTRDSLKALLNNPKYRQCDVVGRALVAIFERQTADEQSAQVTSHRNGVGFGGCDAEFGTICAKFYSQRGFLTLKQLAPWLRVAKNQYPRICKYAKQLDEIAKAKKGLTN